MKAEIITNSKANEKALITTFHYVIETEFPYCDKNGRPVLYDETTGKEIEIDPVTKKHKGKGAYRYEKNYFVGITYQQVPGKRSGIFMNLWTTVFSDLELQAGIFLMPEAKKWMEKIGIDGLRIVRYYDAHPKF